MPYYIAHVSGRSAARRASSRKRASVDTEAFQSNEAAEAVARERWPDGGYFIVEAEDARSAEARAIGESKTLDDLAE